MSDVINKTFDNKDEWLDTVLLGLIALFVPTVLGKFINLIFQENSVITNNSQLIIGSIVNMVLIISALKIKGWKKIIGIVTMPSISTILSGYVFKSSSIYMAYMIPAIWVGNFAIIYTFKLLYLDRKYNYFLSGIIGIIIKVLIIFGAFNILKVCGVFPSKVAFALKSAMGITQLTTASIGMVLVYLTILLKYNFKK